jgi:hypothetical protein
MAVGFLRPKSHAMVFVSNVMSDRCVADRRKNYKNARVNPAPASCQGGDSFCSVILCEVSTKERENIHKYYICSIYYKTIKKCFSGRFQH